MTRLDVPGARRSERIAGGALRAIRLHAAQCLPLECCGLLIGSRAEVCHTFPATNLAASSTRFLIDPADHCRALRRARDQGGDVVGVYHSHPDGPAMPSRRDLAEAGYPEFLYVIVDARAGDVRGYRLTESRFVEVELLAT